jgi:hypothetical protein
MTPPARVSTLGWALAFALFAAVGFSACAERRAPRFPHLTHLAELACGSPGQPACLTCNSCHFASRDGSVSARANTARCGSCHHADAGRVRQVVERAPESRAPIAFDHERHLSMPELRGQCVPCHGGVVKSAASPLPAMSQCFTCHEHEKQWDRAQCSPCHQARDLARTPPETFLKHDQRFMRRHGQLAAEDQRLCQACHTQAQCADCHDASQVLPRDRRTPEKIEATPVHGGGFMVRHALEAQSEPARCARCHAPDTCDSCHRERGVSGTRSDSRNPHPSGWVGSNTGASGFHGREARRDLLACASCHDQGPLTNCIRCHKVGGYGGNPHPGGWQSTQSPREGMCRYCHE